jgi:hypothetical protein
MKSGLLFNNAQRGEREERKEQQKLRRINRAFEKTIQDNP